LANLKHGVYSKNHIAKRLVLLPRTKMLFFVEKKQRKQTAEKAGS